MNTFVFAKTSFLFLSLYIWFKVADMDSAVGVLTDQTFKITVREKKNPGPTTHPTLSNGATLGIRVCIHCTFVCVNLLFTFSHIVMYLGASLEASHMHI